MSNHRGMRVQVNPVEASLQAWWAPDRYGRLADVLGHAMAAPAADVPGAHWHCEAASDAALELSLARDGLCVRLRYRLEDNGGLRIDCEAVAIAPARIGLAAPAFNLHGGGMVADHVLRVAADHYLPAAGVTEVAGSAFDFRQPAPLGARLAWPGAQPAGTVGFDHGFCLAADGLLREAARVADPASGRELRFFTTQPRLRLQSDQHRFCLATEALELPCGAAARHTFVYRLGVQDIDAFDISESVSVALNK
ncbi:hypothetical protein [Janthinobacterium sp. RB2R34]|uniref:aldose epimerase family protein n=1 Tax=Janthinobacterium sp. RB2R34 TaxID=3424193 RepID=UPI003F28F7E9